MYKRAFQSLKRTFMHVSGLCSPYFGLKNQLNYKFVFFYQNIMGDALRHAQTCVSGSETRVYACFRSSPP